MVDITTRNLRRYDHRLRELVQSTGNIQHAIRRGVPRSTAHGWLQSPRAQVVTVDATDMDVVALSRSFQKNQYNAYSVNNITGEKNDDGSMTIHFGGDAKQPNFLPIMDGWNDLIRLYQPRKEIQDGTWAFPNPEPVK